MLFEIEKLSVDFSTRRGTLHAVTDLSLSMEEGECLGIVGESGCGKSVTSYTLMQLLPPNAKWHASKLTVLGKNYLALKKKSLESLRGKEISMIFQDPMSSLNPSFTVGHQVAEVLHLHKGLSWKRAMNKTEEIFERVGIADPRSRVNQYPHELSGGLCQRVMIAMAIACEPKLLIADEPTTALDVTLQAQILKLLKKLQTELKMGLLLITHDLGVVEQMAQRLVVMYAGQIVETGSTREILNKPAHPYTAGLLACLPSQHQGAGEKIRLPSIPGSVPDLTQPLNGCRFLARCYRAQENCEKWVEPKRLKDNRTARCLFPLGETL